MGIEEINDERVDLESKLLKFLRFMWNPLSWVMEFAALMAIGLAIGSTCKHGEIHAVVIATGVHTFYGKAAHLFDNTNRVRHFQKVLTAIINFCICSIALGMIMEIIVKYPIQHRSYRDEIDNLLVLLIGGIPIAMPTVLSVTMDIGSHRLSTQGAITKRMTTIEEMTEMDVLCSDKSGTLTLNKLKVDKAMIKVFVKDMDQETVPLLAARASRVENQDAIDTCIVGMLADPKEIERLCRQSPEAAESSQAAKLQAVEVPPEHRVSDSAVERLSCRLARAERKLKKKDCRMRQQVAAMEVLRGDMSRLQAERDAAMTAEALLREQLAQQPVVSDVAVEAVLEEEEITPELVPVVVADAATVTSPSLDEQARLQADLNFREVEVYVLRTDLAESLQYGQRAAAEIQALIAQLATVDDHAIVKERDAQRNIISDLRSQLGRSQSAVADLEHRAATDAMMVDLRLKLYESETKERYSQMLAEERDAAAVLRSRISYLEGELAGQYAYFESRSRFLSQSRAGSTRGFRRRCREPVPPFFEAGPFSSVPAGAAATPADALGAVTPAASDGSRRRCRNSVEGSGETDDAPSPKRQKILSLSRRMHRVLVET